MFECRSASEGTVDQTETRCKIKADIYWISMTPKAFLRAWGDVCLV